MCVHRVEPPLIYIQICSKYEMYQMKEGGFSREVLSNILMINYGEPFGCGHSVHVRGCERGKTSDYLGMNFSFYWTKTINRFCSND